VYLLLTTASSITISLILAWILWTINDTVSDRGLLRNIVLLTLFNLVYAYLIVYPLVYLSPITTSFSLIFLESPSIIINLIRIVLVARLFGQDQVVVIDDGIGQEISSEWL
jgi:hypothetical protein